MDPTIEEQRSFTVTFEEDLVAEVQYTKGRPRSIFRTRSFHEADARQAKTSVPVPGGPNYLVTETEAANSFLSATLSTIQPLDNHKSLMIITIACHPAPERRFVNATVSWRVSAPPSDADSEKATQTLPPSEHAPKILALAPQHSVGGWTEEQTKLIWGLSLPMRVHVGPGSVGVEPSTERETKKDVLHAMTIIGTVRSAGTRATWTVEENKSSERGIPSHFQFAIVVSHTGPFVSELDFKAELGGGLWSTYLQAKKGKHGNGSKRIIDVDAWKCGDVLWESDEQGWKKYIASFTGEIDGVVQSFAQAIVRP
ncbi:hypothetical protein H0H92_004860 [Tricholoma furcatifolium]|nr:hypothetical protein H0H92_004860 [Tricholoma furcatifolium]